MKKPEFFLLVIALVTAFIACEKEEEYDFPYIVMNELGYENLKTAYQGEEFHIDADVYADAKIEQIILEIHKEDNHKGGGEWVVDSVYTTGYEGLKNTSFHEHLLVPSAAETGSYHFHLSVNDTEGNQAIFEDDITLVSN